MPCCNDLKPPHVHQRSRSLLTARNGDQMAAEGETLVQRIPTGRPDDLAGAALLLCSDAGAYINGVNLYVDGGRAIT